MARFGSIKSMLRIALGSWLCVCAAFGQYRAERVGPPPAEVTPAIASLVGDQGFRLLDGKAPYCEIWLRQASADLGKDASGKAEKSGVTLPAMTEGSFEGLIHFDGDAEDRRGQPIHAGFYTLRYAVMPSNDDHLGAAAHRDFFALVPAADDADPQTRPSAEALAAMSRRASASEHPAVLSVWKSASESDGFSRQGDDWVLETEAAGYRIAVILAGTADR